MADHGQLKIKCGAFEKQLTLTETQKNVINKTDPLVILNGAPGTGKTVVLIAKALEWLKEGNDVIVLATHGASLPPSRFIYHVLTEARDASQRPLFPKDWTWGDTKFEFLHVTTPLSLSQAVDKVMWYGHQGLHVIMDNLEPEGEQASMLHRDMITQLKTGVAGLHLWAAEWFMQNPPGFSVCVLDQPLRYPTPLLFEIFVAIQVMKELNMLPPNLGYSQFDVTSLHPPGPDVIHLRHKGSDVSDMWPVHSRECGRKVGRTLKKVGVGLAAGEGKPGRGGYKYRDVAVLCRNLLDSSQRPAFAQGLEASGIPVTLFGKVTNDSLLDVYDDFVLAREDKVVVTNFAAVAGLDRKVIVCLMGAMEHSEHWQLTEQEERLAMSREERESSEGRLKAMKELKHRLSIFSRCTQQLIIVHLPKGVEPGLSGSENYGKAKCAIL